MLQLQGLFVDGVSASGEGSLRQILNPANGKPVAEIRDCSSRQVDDAVGSAERAFSAWAAMTGANRGRILLAAARLLRERAEEFAQLETTNTGKAISETRSVDIPSAAEALEYFGGVAASLHGEHFDLGASFAYTRREPIGIVVGIGAWNYPLQIAAWKLAPALACGNTMVYKPSELTPITTLKFAELLVEAGLPSGVFNVVTGAGPVGRLLTEHSAVGKVSLTGSVPTGRAVALAAAQGLKSSTLELGGKSPFIVFEDADLDQAVIGATLANFYSQGQVCSNGTRVFVHEKVKSAFTEKLLAVTKRIRIGNPLHDQTQMGPLISLQQWQKVQSCIESGKREGATLLTGGCVPKFVGDLEELNGGYFIEPTIFDLCRDDMTIVREEIFGPVLSLLSFATEEEVVRRANATEFGLAAGIFTRDLKRAHRVVQRLQAGTCWINTYNVTPIEVPFGGVKSSGIGRENSLAVLDHYTQRKSVYVELGELKPIY